MSIAVLLWICSQVLCILMLQFSMGTRSNQVFDGDDFDPNIIQNYLGSSFYHMAKYGEKVYRPFMEVITN